MKRFFYNVRHIWRAFRRPPCVVICCSGQRTATPQVHVSVAGINGIQGVYTWEATAQGNAQATLFGRGLAEIMQRRLIDERTAEEEQR